MDKFSALFRSRRFWVAVAGVLTTVLHDSLGISPETLQPIIGVAIAWIVGDSLNKTA